MFCAPGHVFGRAECVGSRFHILRTGTRYRRYRWRQDPFPCFALPNSFSAVPRASTPVFMYFAPGLVFGFSKGVGSRFHVLHYQTQFRPYRGRRLPFSCFALPNTLSTVRRASGPVFTFCAPGLIFSGNKDVGSHFLAVPWASGPVFMFCAPGLVFSCTMGIGSRFHVLRTRTHFRQYRGRRDWFSHVACPDSFSAVPKATDPVLKFCAPELIFGSTEGVGSRFHVLRSRTRFLWYGGRRVPFSSSARPD
jgi:hypothetical protein